MIIMLITKDNAPTVKMPEYVFTKMTMKAINNGYVIIADINGM